MICYFVTAVSNFTYSNSTQSEAQQVFEVLNFLWFFVIFLSSIGRWTLYWASIMLMKSSLAKNPAILICFRKNAHFWISMITIAYWSLTVLASGPSSIPPRNTFLNIYVCHSLTSAPKSGVSIFNLLRVSSKHIQPISPSILHEIFSLYFC